MSTFIKQTFILIFITPRGAKLECYACRQNESSFAYFWLALTSIFGLCLRPVCLIKSNCYSLIYSSLITPLSYCISNTSSNNIGSDIVKFKFCKTEFSNLTDENASSLDVHEWLTKGIQQDIMK